MAQKKKPQKKKKPKITETATRLKIAECYAKGGTWSNGKCKF